MNTLPAKPDKRWLFFLLIAVLLSTGAIAGTSIFRKSTPSTLTPTPDKSVVTTNFQPISPDMIVYGTWSKGSSEIKGFNLNNGLTYSLATLPSTVKKVSVVSPDLLLFIDEIDAYDHGTQLSLFQISTQQKRVLYKTTDGFGIDDYVMSPNKKYIADWEVAFAPGSPGLVGGRSRVLTIDLNNPVNKHIIYDGVQGGSYPVHYPRAVLDNGDVYCDEFLPNSGAGWAYGMSFTKFDGTGQQELAQMRNGTYGTQPQLSPDGKYLAFAGYDGSLGEGTQLINGFRRAVVMPNTVELFDTQTKTRQIISKFSNTSLYSAVGFDKINGQLIVSQLSKDPLKNGVFSYDLTSQYLAMLNTGSADPNQPNAYITFLSNGKLFVGQKEVSNTAVGNLGPEYSLPYKSFAYVPMNASTATDIPYSDNFMQYIGITNENYFMNTLPPDKRNASNRKDNLQLIAFYLKPNLGTQREGQQTQPVSGDNNCQPSPTITNTPNPTTPPNNPTPYVPPPVSPGPLPTPPPNTTPKCSDLYAAQCKALGIDPGTLAGWQECQTRLAQNGQWHGDCWDSPLYLYGPAGEKVQVIINTKVYNSSPVYNHGYEITLGENGAMYTNGNSYDRLSYDYESVLKNITRPVTGSLVSKNQVIDTLTSYSQKLGLNSKETEDVLEYARINLTAPYIFISFFDQKTSEKILPILFNPTPDSYRNIVFYFKQYKTHPPYSVMPPVFPEPIKRTGLTAVEISEMLE